VANLGAVYISFMSAHSAIEHLNLALGNAVRIRNWTTDLTKTSYTGIFSPLVLNVLATAIVVDNETNEISMVTLNGAITHEKL
jgi:hypothetical protein